MLTKSKNSLPVEVNKENTLHQIIISFSENDTWPKKPTKT